MGKGDSPGTWSHPGLLEQVIKDRNNGINISDHGGLNSEHQGSQIWIMNSTIKCEDGQLTIHLVHVYSTTEDHSGNIPMKGSNAMMQCSLLSMSMIQQISNTVQWTLCSLYRVSYTSYSEK
jgi:hypothetical protein